jgi:S1-C subfamily serine protease
MKLFKTLITFATACIFAVSSAFAGVELSIKNHVRQVTVPLVAQSMLKGSQGFVFAKYESYCSATRLSPLFLVTAAHCIDETTDSKGKLIPDLGKELLFLDHQNTPKVAVVAKINRSLDIALLRVHTVCPCAALGATPARDAPVVAVGYPFGGGEGMVQTLTEGTMQGNESHYYVIHTAQLAPGNSGGGLFNANGELIGVNVAVFSEWTYIVPHMALAIRTDRMKEFLDGF